MSLITDDVYNDEAVMYFHDGEFFIQYGEGRQVSVTMDEDVQELAKQTLADSNFWTAFLAGLSGAVDAAKEQNANT